MHSANNTIVVNKQPHTFILLQHYFINTEIMASDNEQKFATSFARSVYIRFMVRDTVFRDLFVGHFQSYLMGGWDS